jgi:hypothetical protein
MRDPFDTQTAVNDGPIPREARSSDALKVRDVMASRDVGRPNAFDAITAVKDVPIPLEARPDATEPPTRRDEAAATVAADDGEQRGLAKPSVRRVARRWLYVSLLISLACVAGSAVVIVWARGEIRRAGAASPHGAVVAESHAPVQPPAAAVQPPARPATAPAAPVPTAIVDAGPCPLRVVANVRGATVWIDGTAHGTAPADVVIRCGRETTVEIRHPRREDWKRTISTNGGPLELRAELERAHKPRR